MDKRFFTNINDAVRKTVCSKNTQELGQNLDDMVAEVLSTVKTIVKESSATVRMSAKTSSQQQPQPQQQQQQQPNPSAANIKYTGFSQLKRPRKPARGSALGVTLTVLGCVLIPSVSIALLAGGITFLVKSNFRALLTFAAWMLPLLVIGIIFTAVGANLRARYRRCRAYLQLIGEADFISIRQLADETGNSEDFVANDLKRMIQKGMILNGHLDEQKTCLMLGTQTYQQYLAAQKSMLDRQKEEERLRQECEADPQRAELYRTIEEGQSYIRQIKSANDAIPDQDISDRLFQLESVTSRIFAQVEANPKKLPEISRFMRYYLPTTLKLVRAYQQFEAQPVQGENITHAKSEIKDSLNVINSAFETLLDSLFEDDALDISTDISVLHTMLAQEGLTGSDFQPDQTRKSDANYNKEDTL